jgi:(2Fe-2S) ferredoxin
MAIKDLSLVKKHLFLCNGGSCKLLGAEESTAAIRSAIADWGLSDEVHTTKTLCNGRCNDGPIIIAMPDGIWFRKMGKEKAAMFVKEFLLQDQLPQDMVLYKYGSSTIQVGQ